SLPASLPVKLIILIDGWREAWFIPVSRSLQGRLGGRQDATKRITHGPRTGLGCHSGAKAGRAIVTPETHAVRFFPEQDRISTPPCFGFSENAVFGCNPITHNYLRRKTSRMLLRFFSVFFGFFKRPFFRKSHATGKGKSPRGRKYEIFR